MVSSQLTRRTGGLPVRLLFAAICVLACAAPLCAADPEITLVPKPPPPAWRVLTGPAGQQLSLKCFGAVKWLLIDEDCELTPIADGVCIFSAPKPGRYRVVAITDKGDPVPIAVVLGTAPPPKPPVPPPTPVDELRKKLAAALELDKGARADVTQLAAIWREAAKVAADPEVSSSRELLSRVRKVADGLLGADALPAVRGAIAEEVLAALGGLSDDALTADARAKAGELFKKLAGILDTLGG